MGKLRKHEGGRAAGHTINTPSPGSRRADLIRGARKVAITTVNASLAINVLVVIIAPLGGAVDRIPRQILLTTLAVTVSGATVLCHRTIVGQRHQNVSLTGITAIAVTLVSAVPIVCFNSPPTPALPLVDTVLTSWHGHANRSGSLVTIVGLGSSLTLPRHGVDAHSLCPQSRCRKWMLPSSICSRSATRAVARERRTPHATAEHDRTGCRRGDNRSANGTGAGENDTPTGAS